jgi:prevent-host-death family protein
VADMGGIIDDHTCYSKLRRVSLVGIVAMRALAAGGPSARSAAGSEHSDAHLAGTSGAHRSTFSIQRLAAMTIYGHNMTMKAVRIAELKARLSEYLRVVRRGETIAVLDRDTPVAQIVPIRDRSALRIRKPAPGAPRPNQVPLAKPSKLDIDIVELLLEERQPHR